MKNVALSLAGLALIAAGNAYAGETGTINQAGVYEQTMKFYMHPAHYFWSSEQPRLGEHPAVLVKERAMREAAHAASSVIRVHPALIARPIHRSVVAQAD
jgi:hypothetical protein